MEGAEKLFLQAEKHYFVYWLFVVCWFLLLFVVHYLMISFAHYLLSFVWWLMAFINFIIALHAAYVRHSWGICQILPGVCWGKYRELLDYFGKKIAEALPR